MSSALLEFRRLLGEVSGYSKAISQQSQELNKLLQVSSQTSASTSSTPQANVSAATQPAVAPLPASAPAEAVATSSGSVSGAVPSAFDDKLLSSPEGQALAKIDAWVASLKSAPAGSLSRKGPILDAVLRAISSPPGTGPQARPPMLRGGGGYGPYAHAHAHHGTTGDPQLDAMFLRGGGGRAGSSVGWSASERDDDESWRLDSPGGSYYSNPGDADEAFLAHAATANPNIRVGDVQPVELARDDVPQGVNFIDGVWVGVAGNDDTVNALLELDDFDAPTSASTATAKAPSSSSSSSSSSSVPLSSSAQTTAAAAEAARRASVVAAAAVSIPVGAAAQDAQSRRDAEELLWMTDEQEQDKVVPVQARAGLIKGVPREDAAQELQRLAQRTAAAHAAAGGAEPGEGAFPDDLDGVDDADWGDDDGDGDAGGKAAGAKKPPTTPVKPAPVQAAPVKPAPAVAAAAVAVAAGKTDAKAQAKEDDEEEEDAFAGIDDLDGDDAAPPSKPGAAATTATATAAVAGAGAGTGKRGPTLIALTPDMVETFLKGKAAGTGPAQPAAPSPAAALGSGAAPAADGRPDDLDDLDGLSDVDDDAKPAAAAAAKGGSKAVGPPAVARSASTLSTEDVDGLDDEPDGDVAPNKGHVAAPGSGPAPRPRIPSTGDADLTGVIGESEVGIASGGAGASFYGAAAFGGGPGSLPGAGATASTPAHAQGPASGAATPRAQPLAPSALTVSASSAARAGGFVAPADATPTYAALSALPSGPGKQPEPAERDLHELELPEALVAAFERTESDHLDLFGAVTIPATARHTQPPAAGPAFALGPGASHAAQTAHALAVRAASVFPVVSSLYRLHNRSDLRFEWGLHVAQLYERSAGQPQPPSAAAAAEDGKQQESAEDLDTSTAEG